MKISWKIHEFMKMIHDMFVPFGLNIEKSATLRNLTNVVDLNMNVLKTDSTVFTKIV